MLVVHGWENGAYSWDHHKDIRKSRRRAFAKWISRWRRC